VLALNALLGAGTALAPVFVIVFVGLGAWWLLPVLVGIALLALRCCCAALWHRRNLEWQLVHTVPHPAAWGAHPVGIACFDRLLGYGHHWACPCRCCLAKGAGALDLSWVAYAPRGGIPGGFAGHYSHRRCARVRPGRSGLFRILTAQHQLWWRRISPFDRGGLRRNNCLLPGRLRNRRLRHRIAPERNRCSFVDHLRGSQSCRWCDDRACLPGDQATDVEI